MRSGCIRYITPVWAQTPGRKLRLLRHIYRGKIETPFMFPLLLMDKNIAFTLTAVHARVILSHTVLPVFCFLALKEVICTWWSINQQKRKTRLGQRLQQVVWEWKQRLVRGIYVNHMSPATMTGSLPLCVQLIGFIEASEDRRMWVPVRWVREDPSSLAPLVTDYNSSNEPHKMGAFLSNSLGFPEFPQ